MIHRDEILQLHCRNGKGGRGTVLKYLFLFKAAWILHSFPLRHQPSLLCVAQKDSQRVFGAQPSSAACSHTAPESAEQEASDTSITWSCRAEVISACGSSCSTCFVTSPQLRCCHCGPLAWKTLLVSHTEAHIQSEITFFSFLRFFPARDNTSLRENR